jgi:hypothetical protein
MSAGIPPPPLNSPNGSYYWLEWYTQLTNVLNQTGYPFTALSFSGSDIASIQSRNHNELTQIQGGTASGVSPGTGFAYHMTGKGYVSAGGTLTGGPSGWSITNPSAGVYTLTTGLSTALPAIGAMATSNTNGIVVDWIDLSSTGFVTFHLVARNTTTPQNGAFTFLVST